MSARLIQTAAMRHRDQLALEAVRRHWFAYGCSPSYRELGAAIGVGNAATVSAIVRRLERRGLVIRQRGAACAIALPRPLDNHATSALLVELQARGLIVQVVPVAAALALDPVGASARFANDTNQQLPDVA